MSMMFEALSGVLGMKVGPWVQGLNQASSRLSQFRSATSQAFSQIQAASAKVAQGAQAISAAFGAALTAVAADGVRTAASFEQSMSRIKALLSGAITEPAALNKASGDLERLAKKLGAETVYSARQAADAMSNFALAGIKVDEIVAAMPATLSLAAAGQLDIATAADISAKVMRGMGIEASNMAHVTDVLVKAFTTANTDLTQLGEAMKYVGTIANVAGMSLEQTVAPLQIMSDAGIQASMAGTSLRGILGKLSEGGREVTKVFDALGVQFQNADGSVRPLADIIDDFNRRLKETGREAEAPGLLIQAFGERAGPGFAALLERGGDALRQYEKSLVDAGGTGDRIAKIQLDNLAGSFTILTSAIEGVRIGIGERLTPALRSGVEAFTAWVSANETTIVDAAGVAWDYVGAAVERATAAFSSLYERVQPLLVGLAEQFAVVHEYASRLFDRLPTWAQDLLVVGSSLTLVSGVLGSIGGSLPIVGTLFTAIGGLLNPLKLLGGAVGVLGSSFNVLGGVFAAVAGGPITMVGVAIVAAVGSIAVAVAKSQEARDRLAAIWNNVKDVFVAVFAKVKAALAEFWDKFGDSIGKAITSFGELLLMIGEQFIRVLAPVVSFVGGKLAEAFSALLDVVGFVVEVFRVLVAIMSGDFTEAGRAAQLAVAALLDAVAKLIDAWGKLVSVLTAGAVNLSSWSGGLREYAAQLRQSADAADAAADAERRLQQSITDRDREADRVSKADSVRAEYARREAERTRRMEEAQAKFKADIARVTKEFEGQDGQAANLLRYQGMTKAADEFRAQRQAIELEANRDAATKQLAVAEAQVADQRAEWWADEEKRLKAEQKELERAAFLREQYAKSGKELPEHLRERPAAPSTPVATPALPSTTPSSIGTVVADSTLPTSPQAAPAAAPVPATVEFGERNDFVVNQPTAEEAKRQFGGVNRAEAGQLYGQFRDQLSASMAPNEQGVVDPAQSQAVLDKWRTIFEAIPGYSKAAFDQTVADVNQALEGYIGSSTEMTDIYRARIEQAIGDGDQVFADGAQRVRDTLAALREGTANDANQIAHENREYFNKIMAELRGQATTEQMKQMAEMRDAVVSQTQLVGKLHGDAKDRALAALEEMVAAYREKYEEIASGAEKAMDRTAEAAEDAADRSVDAANTPSQSSTGPGGGVINGGVTPQNGAMAPTGTGGGVGNGTNVFSFAPRGGGLLGGLAPNLNMISGMGSMMSGVLSGAMGSVAGGIGAGAAAFSSLVEETLDPVAKLDLLIQNTSAQLSMAENNARKFGTGWKIADQIRADITELQNRKQEEIRKQASEREEADAAARKEWAEERRRMKDREQEEADAREAAGKPTAPVTFVTNFNGVTDHRELATKMTDELRRRGVDMSGRRGQIK